MFNKDTNKATNCPRAVLEAFSGESKDQGQFIRAICNYAQNASLTNRYKTKKSAWVPLRFSIRLFLVLHFLSLYS